MKEWGGGGAKVGCYGKGRTYICNKYEGLFGIDVYRCLDGLRPTSTIVEGGGKVGGGLKILAWVEVLR